jgi:hypothetical protein
MQISEKRNNLSLKSEKGKRRLSGWDNIIWKLKKIPNAPLSLPPHPFESGGGQNPPSSAKVRKILQFLFFCILFLQGVGLRFFSLLLPPFQDRVEPHLWALLGEASQEIL